MRSRDHFQRQQHRERQQRRESEVVGRPRPPFTALAQAPFHMSVSRHTAYNLAGHTSRWQWPRDHSVYLHVIGEHAQRAIAGRLFRLLRPVGSASDRPAPASSRDQRAARDRSAVLRTPLISLGLGLLGALVAAPAGLWFFEHHATIDDGLRRELLAAIPGPRPWCRWWRWPAC